MMINFETLAVQEFPELVSEKRITRKQVNQIVEKHKCRYPSHIFVPHNNISRGVFKFEYNAAGETDFVAPVQESDEEMGSRIKKTYRSVEIMVNSISRGISPSLIISGNAGLGKSYTVKHVLDNMGVKYQFAKGYCKATGLFKLLYENRNPGDVIVIDDNDNLFNDEVALNILKAALELNKSRTIGWLSEKEFVDEDGEVIPRFFEFQGSVIFLTNLDFDALIKSGNKLTPHLQALESRSLYLDMGIKTRREVMMRIRQVIAESDLSTSKGISKELETKMLDYLTVNVDKLKELSLRTFEKLAAIVETDPLFWTDLADTFLLKK
jgi:hypothetical protein